ncbi:hypothetical protein HWD94_03840 [Pseudarthrobacter equi]|uniref:hypothetical protein n=1 Tax=Pseudarthrobacter equi TaxID=728066 RepID=UPI0021C1DB07|nr:hypothetical protein [Pseudarthrobacter equi]MCT9624255.1 hypothetical protein [Pseudarthrobacter equi]
MCLDPSPSDTAIIDRRGRTRFICLSHELMLRAAYTADKAGLIGTDHYQAYVMEHIMRGAEKPRWMPAWAYSKLIQRAASKARLLALIVFLGMASPLRYAPTTSEQKE